MAVTTRQRDNQIGQRLGQTMRVSRVIGRENLGHARDLRRRIRSAANARARDQNGHVAQSLRRRNGLGGRVQRQIRAIDFCNQENSHHTTPASLSFATSSSTEPTLMPALRPAGSAVFTTSRRGLTSTP